MKLIALALFFALPSFAADDMQPTFTIREYREQFSTGLKRDKAAHAAFKASALKAPVIRGAMVPGRVDLTPRVSPPEDQGNCGSCWAFGITKALRSALMLVGLDPGTLAFNYLVNNCGPVHEYGCDGGDFDAGKNFLNSIGPWLEKDDPYTQQDGGRCLGKAPAGTALKYVLVGDGNHPPTFEELASALSQQHMLVVDVAVAGIWGSYSGGIYNGDGSGINHIINLVGYDCETSVDAQGNCVFANGQPKVGGYLIAMNNWGTSWGEKGYMRTRWGRNQIAETAMYFEVAAPVPPPAPPVPPPVPPTPDNGAKVPWGWVIAGLLALAIVVVLVVKK